MFSLLNRIVWILSILLGIIVCAVFAGFNDALVVGVICGVVIKLVVFSKSTIVSSLAEFSSSKSASGVTGQISSVSSSNDISDHSLDDLSSENRSLEALVVQANNVASQYQVSSSPGESTDMHRGESAIESQGVYVAPPREPSKLALYVRNFFSDRPLAKIGGILLFLGSLFFLYLIFDWVPPFGKVIIGMAFGFVLIGLGVYLDQRQVITESRVLFGVGLAINYLTILSARYLLGMGAGSDFGVIFSDVSTTVLLLLNTALAVVISLIYRSKVLLGFAFIFAYLTPFLVVAESQNTYLLSVYILIITGAIGLINSYYARMNQLENTGYLQVIALCGMTALFSFAGIASNSFSEIGVIGAGLFASVVLLSMLSWRMRSSPAWILVAAYIVISVITFSDGSLSFIFLPYATAGLLLTMLAYMMMGFGSILLFSLMSVGLLILSGVGFFSYWLFAEISSGFGIFLSLITLILVAFGFVLSRVTSTILGVIVGVGTTLTLLFGVTLVSGGSDPIPLTELLIFKSLGILMLFGASIFALRHRDARLFLLSIVLTSVLMLYPSMTGLVGAYVGFMGLFFIISLLVPAVMIGRDAEGSESPLMLSLVCSVLSVVISTYQITGFYDMGSILQGGIYMLEAGVYLGYASYFLRRFSSRAILTQSQVTGGQKNTLLMLFALPLSIATFALGFIFHDNSGILSLAWMLEASVLYFVFARLGNIKIFFSASLVFSIGIVEYIGLIDDLMTRDFLALGTSLVALTSLFASLAFLKNYTEPARKLYDILHLMTLIAIGLGIAQIIPQTGSGWSLLAMSLVLALIAPLYERYGQKVQEVSLSVILGLFVLLFVLKFGGLRMDIGSFLIQLGSLVMLLVIGYAGFRSKRYFGYVNFAISIIGFLLVSSLYVEQFFTTFAVSIYLTIIATMLIIRGIVGEKQRFRTIGLYIGSFALLKIFFFDIWTQIDGSVVKVVALMLSGGLMVYLSQLYGKYVDKSWSEEFRLAHIFSGVLISEAPAQHTSSDLPFHEDLAKELRGVDISDVSGVEFIFPSGQSFHVSQESILRLARYLVTFLKKDTFAPGELSLIYDRILNHTESLMKKEELDKLLAQISEWIQTGGTIHFIGKY